VLWSGVAASEGEKLQQGREALGRKVSAILEGGGGGGLGKKAPEREGVRAESKSKALPMVLPTRHSGAKRRRCEGPPGEETHARRMVEAWELQF